MRWVVGREEGLVGSEGERWLAHRAITALVWDGDGWLVLADGREVLRVHGDAVEALGEIGDGAGRYLLPTADARGRRHGARTRRDPRCGSHLALHRGGTPRSVRPRGRSRGGTPFPERLHGPPWGPGRAVSEGPGARFSAGTRA